MGYNVKKEIAKISSEHKKKRIRYRILAGMAAVVVFCTTYALILPAITLGNDLTCDMENHVHDDIICYIDNNADVETEEEWRATLPAQLSGEYRSDLLMTAESQLEYSESLRNIIIDEEENAIKGYTRYGAWAEDPYGDWNRYFLSFCLHYAGIEENEFPQAGGYTGWMESLKEKEFYKEADYVPQTSDILFLDMDADGNADRVALVAELTEDNNTRNIKVIEGDVGGTDNHITLENYSKGAGGDAVSAGDAIAHAVSGSNSIEKQPYQYRSPEGYAGGKVQYVQYESDDARIMGYGILPEQPGIYSYSDDSVQVEVKLPVDGSVPGDAVLTVTPIVSGDENYDTLNEQAESTLDGEVKQIRFYDISFYTTEKEYIPVDDRAQVSIRFKEDRVDLDTDVVVLHYEQEDSTPVVLEQVKLEEVSPEEVSPEGMDPAALDPEGKKAASETVVKFETEGFSTFAVVEVETGTYVTDVAELKASANNDADGYSTVSGLAGQTFVIATEDKEYALTSINYVLSETVGGAVQNNDKLKGMAVLSTDDTTLTVNANKHVLWTFEATEDEGAYYIKSVATGEYLNIVRNRVLLTGDTAQKITVVMNDAREIGLCVEVENTYYYVDRDNGRDYFNTWTGGIDETIADVNRRFVLYQYREDSGKENDNTTGSGVNTDGLTAGNAYIIAGVNFNKDRDADDVVVLRAHYTDSKYGLIGGNVDDKLMFDENRAIQLPLGNITDGIWIFEPTGKENTYYIKSAAYGQYLHIYSKSYPTDNAANTQLGLSEEKQEITVEYAVVNADVKNISCLYTTLHGEKYYVNLRGNDKQENFYAIQVAGTATATADWANHLILIDCGELITGLENRTYLISGVNNQNSPDQAVVMTSGKIENGSRLDGVPADAITVTNYSVESITYADATNAAWKFEYADSLGTYYIQSTLTGEYLNVSEGKLTTGTEKQAIEVVSADAGGNNNRPVRNNIICLRSASDNSIYVQLYGNTSNSDFCGGKHNGTLNAVLQDGGGHLVLTEYLESAELATDLGGKVYFVIAVNNEDYQDHPPALSSTTSDATGLDTGMRGLTGQNIESIAYSGDGKIISVTDGDDTNDLGWLFENTDTPGAYYLRIVNKDNANVGSTPYLNIAENGLFMSAMPQKIEVVEGITSATDPVKDVVCLRANVDGKYYYVNLYKNKQNNNFQSYGEGAENDKANHYALVEVMAANQDLPKVNDVITMINDLLANLVKTENGTYVFSNAAYTGSAAPNNENVGQQGGAGQNSDETFVDDYEQAQTYRTEMQNLARKAWEVCQAYEAYEENQETPEAQKQLRYIYNYGELEKLDWLWSRPSVVGADDVNVTVKLYNYDGTTNDPNSGKTNATLLNKGFRFYHKSEYDSYTAIVDKNRINTKKLGCNESELEMYDTLVNGYPSVKGSQEQGIELSEEDGSLEFLFDETYLVATMENGGGLFQKDSDGFYHYNCDENAAYYDKTQNKFILYDTAVRPMYIHGTTLKYADERFNFLPFNDPLESTIMDDEYIKDGVKTGYLNERPDMWFGMTMEFDFVMPQGGMVPTASGDVPMVFKFKGDDDVLVYIDGRLVMDFSGVHGALEGQIDFSTGAVTDKHEGTKTLGDIFAGTTVQTTNEGNRKIFVDNTVHKLQFFYMERGGNVSYNSIEYNITTVPQKNLLVGKEIELPQGVVNTAVIDNKYFTFRVIQATGDGTAIKEEDKEISYFAEGAAYEIWKYNENTGKYENTNQKGTVDENGYFSLRAGYAAKFIDVLNENNRANLQCSNYIIQEVIPSDEGDQYSDVGYQFTEILVDGTTGAESEGTVTSGTATKTELIDEVDDTDSVNVFSTSAVEAGKNYEVILSNKVIPPLGDLYITKELPENAPEDASDQIFTIRVILGDADVQGNSTGYMLPLAKGTPYMVMDQEDSEAADGSGAGDGGTSEGGTVAGEPRTVDNDNGYIYLKAGQTAVISGILAGTDYEVTEVLSEGQEFTPHYDNAIGEFQSVKEQDTNEKKVVVLNIPYDFSLQIPISKQVMYCTEADTFHFSIVPCKREDTDTNGSQFVEMSEENSDTMEGIAITVAPKGNTQHPIENGTIVLAYERENTKTGTYYYKVREDPGGGNYIYDSTFYIVEVTITEDENGVKTATVTDILENGTISWKEQGITEETSLPFVNKSTTSVTIKKTIASGDTSTKFIYDVIVTDENGNPVQLAEGDAGFSLGHNEGRIISGIPYGAEVTVTEHPTDEYSEAFSVSARYEAEYGTVSGGDIAADNSASGGLYAGPMDAGATYRFPINPVQANGATMHLVYSAEAESSLTYMADEDTTEFALRPTGVWGRSESIHITLPKSDGGTGRSIVLSNTGTSAVKLDYIDLEFNMVAGNEAKVQVLGDETMIHFTNSALYEIPETGGGGTRMYILGGFLTMLSALTFLLIYSKNKRSGGAHEIFSRNINYDKENKQ